MTHLALGYLFVSVVAFVYITQGTEKFNTMTLSYFTHLFFLSAIAVIIKKDFPTVLNLTFDNLEIFFFFIGGGVSAIFHSLSNLVTSRHKVHK